MPPEVCQSHADHSRALERLFEKTDGISAIKVQLEEIMRELRSLTTILVTGNGQPGLKTQVEILTRDSEEQRTQREHDRVSRSRAVMALVVGLIGAFAGTGAATAWAILQTTGK